MAFFFLSKFRPDFAFGIVLGAEISSISKALTEASYKQKSRFLCAAVIADVYFGPRLLPLAGMMRLLERDTMARLGSRMRRLILRGKINRNLNMVITAAYTDFQTLDLP